MGLAVGQGGREVGVAGVELGDDDRPRHPDEGALVPQRAALRVGAVGGRDDEEGGIRRPQSCPHLPDEVGEVDPLCRSGNDAHQRAVAIRAHQRIRIPRSSRIPCDAAKP